MAAGASLPDTDTPAGAAAPIAGGVSSWSAWATVALLFLASIVSVIDRTLLSIVVDPIKGELGVTDVQIGLLQGIAFGLFYATMGVWLGLVADRTNRRNLIIVGILLWSLATVGGGLAANFGQFFVSRMLVGLGEASLAPAAISLIADLFEPGRRGRAIGCYLMGQALANGLSLTIAGYLLNAAGAGHFEHLGPLAALTPWRVVFVVCGLGGSLVGFAFFLTREPARGTPVQPRSITEQAGSAIRYILRGWRQFAGIYLGFAIYFLGAYGAGVWQVVMVSRQFGMSPAEVSILFGPFAIGLGLAGPLVGGSLIDWVVRRRGTYGLLWLLAVAPLLAVPSALAVLADSPRLAIILAASQSGCSAIVGSATLAYLQSAIPAEMRGFSVSLTGLMNTLLGNALGPMFVALVTERVLHDHAKVGWGILTVAVPAFCLSALLYAITAWMNRHRMTGPAV